MYVLLNHGIAARIAHRAARAHRLRGPTFQTAVVSDADLRVRLAALLSEDLVVLELLEDRLADIAVLLGGADDLVSLAILVDLNASRHGDPAAARRGKGAVMPAASISAADRDAILRLAVKYDRIALLVRLGVDSTLLREFHGEDIERVWDRAQPVVSAIRLSRGHYCENFERLVATWQR